MRGVVQSFDDKRGFGFIVDEKQRLFFVHYSQIQSSGFKSLKIGQKVEFNGYETDQGFEAKDVKVYE